MNRSLFLIGIFLGVICISGYSLNHFTELYYTDDSQSENDDVSFSDDVFPILSNHCLSCHEDGNSSGEVNLEDYENIVPLVNSGLLLNVINHDDGYSHMPDEKLDDSDIEIIQTWIDQGIMDN